MGLRESATTIISRGSDAATVTLADTILISIWAGLIAGIIQVRILLRMTRCCLK